MMICWHHIPVNSCIKPLTLGSIENSFIIVTIPDSIPTPIAMKPCRCHPVYYPSMTRCRTFLTSIKICRIIMSDAVLYPCNVFVSKTRIFIYIIISIILKCTLCPIRITITAVIIANLAIITLSQFSQKSRYLLLSFFSPIIARILV